MNSTWIHVRADDFCTFLIEQNDDIDLDITDTHKLSLQITDHMQSKISVTILNDVHDTVPITTQNDRTGKLSQTAATYLSIYQCWQILSQTWQTNLC